MRSLAYFPRGYGRREGAGGETLDGGGAVHISVAWAHDLAYYKVAMIAAHTGPPCQQTFTGSGFAAGALAATGGEQATY